MNTLKKATRNHRSAIRKWVMGTAAVSAAMLVLWSTTGQAIGVATTNPQTAVSGQAATEVKSVITVSAVKVVSKATPEQVLEGVVNREGNKFYIGAMPVVQGDTGVLQLALENRSDQKVLAKIEVAGLPPTIAVNVEAAAGHSQLRVVRLGQTTFLAEIKGAQTAAGHNLEVQWTPGLATAPTSYPVQVSIQPVTE
ncbi:MAG: hypothetical protein HYY01_07730 [Chloroflexi bacterium]|nr:hypothetical protein [Chloroflexota bacterium]